MLAKNWFGGGDRQFHWTSVSLTNQRVIGSYSFSSQGTKLI